MNLKSTGELIDSGMKVADYKMFQSDKIWSRYSNDKVDIGEQLSMVIRHLHKRFPLNKKIRALSIGSSDEPQFRILETSCTGGLYLFDVEQEALDIVKERIKRQHTEHVTTIKGDYNKVFLDAEKTENFLNKKLGCKRVDLITLHHSLYYADETKWHLIFENLYKHILSKSGAIHVVLMSSKCSKQNTTTWLYNYFVSKYFKQRNNQDLITLKTELTSNNIFKNSRITTKRDYIKFFVDDFEKFMAVVWMIMLYPNVHLYTKDQKREITEYVFNNLWKRKKPIIQSQDHLFLYRGFENNVKG